MSTVKQCTPGEIEVKRKLALELRNKRKAAEQKDDSPITKKPNLSHNHEYRLPMRKDIENPVTTLTSEQKAQIERNRLEAIARAAANKLIPAEVAEDLAAKKISPGKVPHVFLKPRNGSSHPTIGSSAALEKASPMTSTSSRPQTLTEKSNTVAKVPTSTKPNVTVLCQLRFISKDRFEALTDTFSDAVITEFKKIRSKSYNAKTRQWSFSLSDYEQLCKSLTELDAGCVNLERIPEFVMKCFRRETPITNASCLDSIEKELVDSLLEFQKEGVLFGIARGGRVLLADDMGLGKTYQALAIADFYKTDWPLLIVTTASMRHVWNNKVIELLPSVPVHNIRVLDSGNDSISGAQILICSFAGLENVAKLLKNKFGVIIFDESHSLKNLKSKQTGNAIQISERASRVILLTGTPALSRPAELFPQLQIIDKSFATWFQFTKRFCGGRSSTFGWQATGCENTEELNALLSKIFMIRRTKQDVMSELGEKQREIVELTNLKLSKVETNVMNRFAEDFQSNQNKKQREQIMIEWNQNTAQIKAQAVGPFIEKVLQDDDGKVLIFAIHHNVMDAVSELLAKKNIPYVRIDGKTKSETRSENVSNFQNDSNIRCAVLSIRACSAGITLTAASTVIFAELDWTPSNIIQAEARAHRIGQERPVKIFFLIARGTSDDVMWQMLKEKQRNLGGIGLVAGNEHFSQNMVITKFEAETPKKNLITNHFSRNDSASSDVFYTCEQDLDDDSFDVEMLDQIDAAVSEAENQQANFRVESSYIEELLQGIEYIDDDDLSFMSK